MYQKHLRGTPPVYYRYSPPLALRNEEYAEKLPNPPFPEAKPWQCSVYYYWWLFLRAQQEASGYRFEIEQKLADVLEPQTTNHELAALRGAELKRTEFGFLWQSGFLNWWITTGRHLFCEPIRQGVRALNWQELEYGINFRDNLSSLADSPNIYLEIAVHHDFDQSIEEVRSLLRQAKKRQPVLTYDEPLFPVFTKPVLTSLEKIYQVYTLRQSDRDLSLADIAVKSGLATNAYNTDTATKAANASAASRALKQASLILKWVDKGVFPVTSAAQEKQAAFMAERVENKLVEPEVMRAFRDLRYQQQNSTELIELAERHGLDLEAVR